MGNAWFVNEVLFVPIPDDESAALNTLDLRKSAVADELFREVLSCSGKPSEGDEIRLTKYLPDQLDYAYQLSEERVAVFSEVYYPKGWHLYCDGKEIPIGRVNYTLRAAVLPAGSHTLHMEFVPDALAIDNLCIALIIIGILLSIGSLAWPLYKKYIPIKQTTRA